MTTKINLSLRNAEPAYDDAASAAPGGDWAGPVTMSFLVAGLPYYSLASTDYLGYLRACPAGWQNIAVAVGDQVSINWGLPANQEFEKILILGQEGASWSYGSACYYKLTGGWLVDGSATSTVLDNNTSLSTLAGGVPAAYPSISLGPLRAVPEWRDLHTLAADGVAVPVDYAIDSVIKTLALELDITGCGRSDYNRILRWAHRGLRVRAEDTDTAAYVQAVSGLLQIAGGLMSAQKGGGNPGFSVVVDTEELY